MNTKRIGKLATVAASAALTLQLFAGASSAAVPNAHVDGAVLGYVGGDGWAGLHDYVHVHRHQHLAKLYLEIDVVGRVADRCHVRRHEERQLGRRLHRRPARSIKCMFKTVANGDVHCRGHVRASTPATRPGRRHRRGRQLEPRRATIRTVATAATGDAWGDRRQGLRHGDRSSPRRDLQRQGGTTPAASATSTLSHDQTVTEQHAGPRSLTGLPSGKSARVNDDGGATLYGGFSAIDISVDGGNVGHDFQLVITYPKNTQAPKSYVHLASAGDAETSTSSARRASRRSTASPGTRRTHRDAVPPAQRAAAPDAASRAEPHQAVAGSARSSLTRAADDRSPFASYRARASRKGGPDDSRRPTTAKDAARAPSARLRRTWTSSPSMARSTACSASATASSAWPVLARTFARAVRHAICDSRSSSSDRLSASAA